MDVTEISFRKYANIKSVLTLKNVHSYSTMEVMQQWAFNEIFVNHSNKQFKDTILFNFNIQCSQFYFHSIFSDVETKPLFPISCFQFFNLDIT